MAYKIQIFDGLSPMLDEVAAANYGLGLDALDHAGGVIRDAQRAAFRSNQDWRQRYVRNKKGKIVRLISKRGLNILGQRISHKNMKNSDSPPNMKSLITSYLNAKQMYVLVGGMHPAFTPMTRREGKVVGRQRRVSGVPKSSYAILQKLDSGSTDGDYTSLVRPKSMARFKNAQYKARNFMARGRASASAKVKDIMTSKLESLIHKQVNRTRVKTREVKTS